MSKERWLGGEDLASNNLKDLNLVVDKLGIDRIKRHIFLCVGEKCCSQELGMKTWEFLKERCRQADAAEVGVYRTKVSCLRICQKGPIALVYPEGVWYGNVTIDACKRIFDEHVIGGKIVDEYKITEHALHPDSTNSINFGETP